MPITYFGSAANPADNGTLNGLSITITPPTSMQAGDLVFVIFHLSVIGNTVAVGQSGGQTWTSEDPIAGTSRLTRVFWCRFNGTWTFNPRFDHTFDGGCSGIMHVFRPSGSMNNWEIDVPQIFAIFNAPSSSPYNVTISGINTNEDSSLVLATWISRDDNQFVLQTAGWSNAGSAQYRNLYGNDHAISTAYKIQTLAGATGDVVNKENTNGPDAGISHIIAFKEIPFESIRTLDLGDFDKSLNFDLTTQLFEFTRTFDLGDFNKFLSFDLGRVEIDPYQINIDGFEYFSSIDLQKTLERILVLNDFDIQSSINLSETLEKIIALGDFNMISSWNGKFLFSLFSYLVLKFHLFAGNSLILKNNLNVINEVRNSLILKYHIPPLTDISNNLVLLNSLVGGVEGDLQILNRLTDSITGSLTLRNKLTNKNEVEGTLILKNNIDPQSSPPTYTDPEQDEANFNSGLTNPDSPNYNPQLASLAYFYFTEEHTG